MRREGTFRTALGVLLCALLGLALTGCSGAGSTPTKSTPSATGHTTASPAPTATSPTPSASPTADPPTLSPAAGQKTNTGAIAFANYWVQSLNYAYVTLDARPFARTSSARCSFCQKQVHYFDTLSASGSHFVGFGIVLRSNEIVSGDHRYHANLAIDVTVQQNPGRLINSSGKTVDLLSGPQATTNRLWLQFVSGAWIVVQIGNVE